MTNQEAIERIQSIKSKVSLYDDVMALRMAEKALENQKSLEEELLDLKSEIENYEMPIYDQTYCRGLKKAMEFIDNRIAELKGENEDFNHEGFYNFLLNTIQPNEMEKYRNMFLSSGEIVK